MNFILARRLEREVKEILDDFSADEGLKANLLKGKRVDLAEELSKMFCFFEQKTKGFFFRTCSTSSRKTRRIYWSIKCRKIILFFCYTEMLIMLFELFFF
jgi:hypothetical protein